MTKIYPAIVLFLGLWIRVESCAAPPYEVVDTTIKFINQNTVIITLTKYDIFNKDTFYSYDTVRYDKFTSYLKKSHDESEMVFVGTVLDVKRIPTTVGAGVGFQESLFIAITRTFKNTSTFNKDAFVYKNLITNGDCKYFSDSLAGKSFIGFYNSTWPDPWRIIWAGYDILFKKCARGDILQDGYITNSLYPTFRIPLDSLPGIFTATSIAAHDRPRLSPKPAYSDLSELTAYDVSGKRIAAPRVHRGIMIVEKRRNSTGVWCYRLGFIR
jgi:hypothetical protein